MSFLSATLLLGTLAAGVPIALHLLARQPPRRVVFPAVSFLRQRLTTQSSRLRVRRWWLLALRVLALIVFAMVLARPHINAAATSQWLTMGLLLIAGVGMLGMASTAFSRGMARSLAWTLLFAAILLACISVFTGVRTAFTTTGPQFEDGGPMAVAIVIDNSPSSAWRTSDPFRGAVESIEVTARGTTEELREQQGLDLAGTRLSVALERAGELIDALPQGSRVAIIDRSASPAGFSLDPRAARARLDRITPHAVPEPITARITTAVELVRTSNLPYRQVVVISDMAAASWDENVPTSSDRSPLMADQHDDVPISILNTHERTDLDGRGKSAESVAASAASAINPWISPPQVGEVAPAPGTAIPIRFDVGVWDAEATTGTGDTKRVSTETKSPQAFSATVQLSLYEQDPSLPVVRDGKVVLPPLKTVDRASIELGNGTAKEVSLTLPPLPRGTHHAVVELIGSDRFEWDNIRFVTVDLPAPPHVLMVGDDADETTVMAAAMTAPHAPGDPSASYHIETVSYRDLAAVDWNLFDLVMLIDPPLRFDARAQANVGSAAGITTTMWNDIAQVVSRGGGLVISLGPATEMLGVPSDDDQVRTEVSPADAIIPPIVRLWRIPVPGTFWQVTESTHPVFSTLMRPTSPPNWSDFRIRRYWQVSDGSAFNQPATASATPPAANATWKVIARYPANRDDPTSGNPAVLVKEFEQGRIALTTTPLPALSANTRSWNDLFGAGDAWPAFMAVRGLAAWAAGIDRSETTILAGQTALLHLNESADEDVVVASPRLSVKPEIDETTPTVELYTPGQPSGRSLPVENSSVLIDDTLTPGTYFLRGADIWSGLSANLPAIWSQDKSTQLDTLIQWFGDDGWSIANELNGLSLQAGGRAGAPVSLHGPLMLLAVLIFLTEQLLSNRFYGSSPAAEAE
ncbi:BatA domain-containing protein [Allorhodopirellula heiligendammensis]|uniref:Aerotolerance regulator N-terminal domain-containing protein n=1 Tax=Allorhodopirellula heiligendammensis TaxID=2714739 RepID=A0A5C6BFI0_9BACT|nr:BatA domain-containing protein [Allorhodopirellula heiligendammensis]TWU10893.1 hypothetical protein Poly21_47990 [Allorhodopirellula heiligendammensis]